MDDSRRTKKTQNPKQTVRVRANKLSHDFENMHPANNRPCTHVDHPNSLYANKPHTVSALEKQCDGFHAARQSMNQSVTGFANKTRKDVSMHSSTGRHANKSKSSAKSRSTSDTKGFKPFSLQQFQSLASLNNSNLHSGLHLKFQPASTTLQPEPKLTAKRVGSPRLLCKDSNQDQHVPAHLRTIQEGCALRSGSALGQNQIVSNQQSQLPLNSNRGLSKGKILKLKSGAKQILHSTTNQHSQRFFVTNKDSSHPTSQCTLQSLSQNPSSLSIQKPNHHAPTKSGVPPVSNHSILLPRTTVQPQSGFIHPPQPNKNLSRASTQKECGVPPKLANNFFNTQHAPENSNSRADSYVPMLAQPQEIQMKQSSEDIEMIDWPQHPSQVRPPQTQSSFFYPSQGLQKSGASQQQLLIQKIPYLRLNQEPFSDSHHNSCDSDGDITMSCHYQQQTAKQRLNYFWKVTAKQISLQQAATIDRDDVGRDTQLVPEYCLQISQNMLRQEKECLPSPQYMSNQQDINEKMRAILVDWIIEVHLKYKLQPETLFLTVNLIDRCLEVTSINRQYLQLVGVTAMFIASKYEEIYPPPVSDFVYITNNAYSKQEIFMMEQTILTTLDFKISVCTPYRFLERFCKAAEDSEKLWNLARYLIELPLIEQRMLQYPPSVLAAASLYLSRKLLFGFKTEWTPQLQKHVCYSEAQLNQCVADLCILLDGIGNCSLQAARKKFSLRRYHEVAKFQWSNNSQANNIH